VVAIGHRFAYGHAMPRPLATAVPPVDAVVIGRNEGARLEACLRSLQGRVRRVIYVDSGSTDGSVQAAQALGAEVVALDMTRPFTAARARNAGLARLSGDGFVQMVDGDCELQPGWIDAALAAMAQHPHAVVVCGRRRERFPRASLWNRLCDREWDTPVGQALACGGDALMRLAAVQAVGGYREDLIAGEEPELCLRLRRAGGQVWRIDAEMTLHDAAMTRFGQWWQRSRRAGHAFAEGAALHGAGPERHWVTETRRALIWGLGVPLAAIAAAGLHPAGWLILLAWPLQVCRLALRWRDPAAALFNVLGKLAEAQGVLGYWWGRLRGRRRGLIEYK
jgi:GT2 family glycosyltransferase